MTKRERILAALEAPGARPSKVAKRFGVGRQYVSLIRAQHARQATAGLCRAVAKCHKCGELVGATLITGPVWCPKCLRLEMGERRTT